MTPARLLVALVGFIVLCGITALLLTLIADPAYAGQESWRNCNRNCADGWRGLWCHMDRWLANCR